MLAVEKQRIWALKALLEHIPAARMLPKEMLDASLLSSLQGKLAGSDEPLYNPATDTASIIGHSLLQQLTAGMYRCRAAKQKLIDGAIERDRACCQLLRDHYGAMLGGGLSNG